MKQFNLLQRFGCCTYFPDISESCKDDYSCTPFYVIKLTKHFKIKWIKALSYRFNLLANYINYSIGVARSLNLERNPGCLISEFNVRSGETSDYHDNFFIRSGHDYRIIDIINQHHAKDKIIITNIHKLHSEISHDILIKHFLSLDSSLNLTDLSYVLSIMNKDGYGLPRGVIGTIILLRIFISTIIKETVKSCMVYTSLENVYIIGDNAEEACTKINKILKNFDLRLSNKPKIINKYYWYRECDKYFLLNHNNMHSELINLIYKSAMNDFECCSFDLDYLEYYKYGNTDQNNVLIKMMKTWPDMIESRIKFASQQDIIQNVTIIGNICRYVIGRPSRTYYYDLKKFDKIVDEVIRNQCENPGRIENYILSIAGLLFSLITSKQILRLVEYLGSIPQNKFLNLTLINEIFRRKRLDKNLYYYINMKPLLCETVYNFVKFNDIEVDYLLEDMKEKKRCSIM